MSHNLLFFSLYKTSKKQNFLLKTIQILILRIEYLKNGSADFNDFGVILQDF